MTTWTNEELKKIEKADELNLSSLRKDGSYRKPVIMWVVRLNDELYVRAVKGRSGPWFRGVLILHEGRIRSGGVEKDVSFVEAPDSPHHAAIDAAYVQKYSHYPKSYVDACLTPEAQAATIQLVRRTGEDS
jgi:hypothetical protein